jgi:ethanolamine ammonia-lyase large subunit
MLNYQSTSFHDALYVRKTLGLKPAPEFEIWLNNIGIMKNGFPEGNIKALWDNKIEKILGIAGNF